MRLLVVASTALICGHTAVVATLAAWTAAATGSTSLDGSTEQPLDGFHVSPISCRTEQLLWYNINMLPVNPKFCIENKQNKLIKKLSPTHVQQLESTSVLTTPEKVNILALFIGYKWITDVAIDQEDKAAASKVLQQLGLPHEENYYEYNGERHTWLQVAANPAILRYILERRESLSVLEAGVLYGYPVSHSLGYIGMLEKEMKGSDKSIAEFYLSGVFSCTYSDRETEYFEEIWKEITALSPMITSEAKIYYEQFMSA